MASGVRKRTSPKTGQVSYQARYEVNGRELVATFARLRDAVDWRAAQVLKVRAGGSALSSDARRESVATLWAEAVKQNRWQTNTARLYDGIWELHVARRWAHIPVVTVNRADVRAWVADLQLRIGQSRVRHCVAVLSACMNVAVDKGLREVNPCTRLKLKMPELKRREEITTTDVIKVIDAAEHAQLKTMIRCAAGTGVRYSELVALTRADVKQGQLEVLLTKNGRPRTVPLLPRMRDELKAVQTEKNALLFVGQSGHPLSYHTGIKQLRRAIEVSGVKTIGGWHDFRRYFATMAVSRAGVKAAQDWLGHTTAAMTMNIYAQRQDAETKNQLEAVGLLYAEDTDKPIEN